MLAEAAPTLVPIFGVGALVVAALVARLPVATCSECPHCRAAVVRAQAEERRAREEYERRAGIPPRLWGRPDDDRRHDDEDPPRRR